MKAANQRMRPFAAGTAVTVRAFSSEPGKGLSYPACTVTLCEPCETAGWDVIDAIDSAGRELSIYSFSVDKRA